MGNSERLAKQREKRRKNGNLHTKTYEKTKNGLLMRTYRNMKSRVTGIQHLKAHLYQGLFLLPKEEFYTWAKNSLDFHSLFEAWVESGYDRKLSPSIDRVNSREGYLITNMRWITHSDNSRRGANSRHFKSTI